MIITQMSLKVNPKELNFSGKNVYNNTIPNELFVEKEGSVVIGEAVRQRILELCQARKITVNKLATMSGITQSTLSNIVSGRNNSATVSTIKKICDGLDITIVEFFQAPCFENLEQELK